METARTPGAWSRRWKATRWQSRSPLRIWSSATERCPAASFSNRCERDARDELEFAAKLKHSTSLLTALSATWKFLSGPAVDLLVLASVLASAPIPAEVIDITFARLYDCSPDDAEAKRLEATADTDQFALSRVDPARAEARRVHPLVARAARQHIVSPERVAIVKAAAVAALSEYALRGITYARVFRLGLESLHARELSANRSTGQEAVLLAVVGSFDLARGESIARNGRAGARWNTALRHWAPITISRGGRS